VPPLPEPICYTRTLQEGLRGTTEELGLSHTYPGTDPGRMRKDLVLAESPASANGVTWDLSDLYSGPDDPMIETDLAEAQSDAVEFATAFRGLLGGQAGITAEQLVGGVTRLEALYDRIGKVSSYAHLLYAANTADNVIRDLLQKVEQHVTTLHNTLLFFELEWLAVPDDVATRLLNDSSLQPYRHYQEAERRYKPHILSEAEEKIVNEKDQTGPRAFIRLFTELTSGLTFPMEQDGATQKLTLSQILALMARDPNRETRRAAHDSLFSVLSEHGQVLTFTYDNLVQDHLTMDRLRHYTNPMEPRHLSNEVDAASVEHMMDVTEDNYVIGQDYFRLKAKLLNLPKLKVYDQYAPLAEKARTVPFDQAKDIVVHSLGAFSPRFADIAMEFFENRWIDAELRPGKRGGAFCASPSPSIHPYILQNYTDDARDVMTLAHEMGHGIHGYLARKQTAFNYHGGLPLAETASVFAEMLVFDHLTEQESDPAAQLSLVAGKVEDMCATVFRQTVLTRFEQDAFAARREARLTDEKLCDLWLAANGRYYGTAVELSDGYRWGWSYIPHFINTRFYCYSYVFGELLVLALYGLYRESGSSFVPIYQELLERGGSAPPDQLLKPLGVDFRDADFWQRGFRELRRMVERAEALSGQASHV